MKRLLISILAVSLFAAAGCQSFAPGPAASGRVMTAGGTTFVQVPTGQGGYQVVAYSQEGAKVCPECKAIAAHYFETGELDQRVCKVCGASLNVGQGVVANTK
ncbi:MAG: hypothetical protein JWP03_4882 [Phycisphaerales bacterium]|nr:hypothetical protein [Phycisphaerales bacterium]